MIRVNCTQCRAQLEMDDAFAGGVCRCQYCGTIQTVPSLSKLKRQTAPTAAAAPAGPAMSPASPQPHGAAAATAEASGLEALAEAVASSSGLGRGSLRSGPARQAPAPPAAATAAAQPPPEQAPPVEYARASRKPRPVVLVAGVAVGAALVLALGAMMFSGGGTNRGVGPATRPGPGPGTDSGNKSSGGEQGGGERFTIPLAPHFCGIDLAGERSVVYLLDRGSGTGDMFDTLKEATFASVQSLKTDQKFAIIFWSNGAEAARYPAAGMADVRPEATLAAREQFKEVYSGGRAEPHDAIRAARELRPSAVILVTAKAFSLEDDVVDLCLRSFARGATKVHTVALGSDDLSTVLKRISQATGGQSRIVTRPQLKDYSY